MKLVTKYQISAINSYREKCDGKYLGRTEGQTDRGKTVYPPPSSGSRGIKILPDCPMPMAMVHLLSIFFIENQYRRRRR
jgi:hypothetical protein